MFDKLFQSSNNGLLISDKVALMYPTETKVNLN